MQNWINKFMRKTVESLQQTMDEYFSTQEMRIHQTMDKNVRTQTHDAPCAAEPKAHSDMTVPQRPTLQESPSTCRDQDVLHHCLKSRENVTSCPSSSVTIGSPFASSYFHTTAPPSSSIHSPHLHAINDGYPVSDWLKGHAHDDCLQSSYKSQVTCIDAAFLSATVSLDAALASFQNVCTMHKQRKPKPVSNWLKGNACSSPMAMRHHNCQNIRPRAQTPPSCLVRDKCCLA